MALIDRFHARDRVAVDALYRRVFGHDMAEANRLRWEWQYDQNPNNPAGGPQIWLAREGPAVVGQYATMPVRLAVQGKDLAGSWGMDVMVAPERQRQGLGEMLFRTWDQHVDASLGLGASGPSAGLFQKLRWPNVGPVPRLVKPLTRRAVRRPLWPDPVNSLLSAVTLPVVRVVSRRRPLQGEIEPTRRFGRGFSALWDRLQPKFDLAVRRDAAYLNWKYLRAPHVRYSVASLMRDGDPHGYVVYRHVREPRGRVTLLVDFLADPDDAQGFLTLLRFVDREARAADSDKIRTFAMHAAFRRLLRKSGYFGVKSTLAFVVRINALSVPNGFYTSRDRWHVTLGDADLDR